MTQDWLNEQELRTFSVTGTEPELGNDLYTGSITLR